MKRPLSWHRECLANQIASRDRALEAVKRAQRDYERHVDDVEILRAQVERAEREGLVEFDRDKFNKPRTPPAAAAGRGEGG